MKLDDIRTYKLSIESAGTGDENRFLKEDTDLTITDGELLHAVISCVIPDERALPDYPGKRRAELLRRFSLMEYSLEASGEYLQKSRQTLELDESERSLVSYYLGMIITRLVNCRMYGESFLVPIKNIQMELGCESLFYKGRRRTDLIGCEKKDERFAFSVWEAKGRSNNSDQALRDGRKEAAQILSINDQLPVRAEACMSYYGSRCLSVRVQDAMERKEDNGFSVHVPPAAYFRAYYDSVYGLIRECYEKESVHNKIHLGQEEIQAVLPVSQGRVLEIGLPRKLFFALMENDDEQLLSSVKELKPDSDGIYVAFAK